jgi:hypothetical protein
LKKPRVAKGAAPTMHTQLSVSIPKNGLRRKYNPTAIPQAKTENTN